MLLGLVGFGRLYLLIMVQRGSPLSLSAGLWRDETILEGSCRLELDKNKRALGNVWTEERGREKL